MGAAVSQQPDFARDADRAYTMADGPPEGDLRAALEHQFRHMRARLVTWFRRRVGDPVEAEDLAQECFLRVANREDPDIVANFEAYLYRTARSVLFDRRRRRSVRQADDHVSLLPEHDPIEELDALRELLAQEKLQQVTATLMTMPERTRAIFILCRLEGQRYAEIARRFDISVSAVQKHMLRAIETLTGLGEDEA